MKKMITTTMIIASTFVGISSASASYYGETSIYAPKNSVGQSGAFAND